MLREIRIRRESYDLECTNNLLLTIGGDFKFEDAHFQFFNLDQLIKQFE